VIVKTLILFKSLSCKKISFFFISLFFWGCTTHLDTYAVSGIDADFKFKKLSSAQQDSTSETVGFYQNTLRSSLYSECDYFPSDSVYSQTLSKRCGSFAPLLKTFSRFILEPDSAYIGLGVRPTTGKYKFVDLPESCEIF
jgi:putative component of membrane protein insertase Oxa1/YidC/SpoIIIJ protein YidD